MVEQNKTKEMYKKLPAKIRAIIASLEFSKMIDDIAQKNSLNKNQRDLVAREVSEILMGIKNKNEIQKNLTDKLGVDDVSSQKIVSDIENKIIINIDNIYEEIQQNIATEEVRGLENEKIENITSTKPETNTPTAKEVEEKPVAAQPNPIGQDFQKIIMNQAKAMQPAVPADRIMNHESRSMNGKEEKPANLPTGNNESRVIHNYITGSDPYREPVE